MSLKMPLKISLKQTLIPPCFILATNFAFAQQSIQQPTKKLISDSDYVLRLDNGDLQRRSLTALAGLGQELRISMSSFSVGSQPSVQVNGVQLVLKPGQVQYSADGLGLKFQASQISAAVSVGEIKVDQVVEKDLGGVIARIQVSASCRGAQLQFADPSAVATAQFSMNVVGSELQLSVENPQVQLGSSSLNISNMTCDGAQGFEDLIRNEIAQLVGDTPNFRNFIREQYVQRLMAAAVSFHLNWQEPKKLFEDQKLQAWVYPESIHFEARLNAWFNQGRLQMIPRGATARQDKPYHFAKPELILQSVSQETALLLPENFVLEIVNQYFNRESFVIIKRSSEIPAFQSLMGSFFGKLFLWPDLLFFRKSTDFLFIGELSEEPRLAWTAGKGLQLQLSLPLTVDMRYEQDGKHRPFVRFDLPTTATMPISVSADAIQLKGQNLAMDLSYQYDPQYCETQKNSCGSISKKTLKKSLQDFAGALSYQVPLPQMEVFSNVIIKSQRMERDLASGAVVFYLK